MEKAILELEQVTGKAKKFGLKNISFSLPAGYIMGLMGSNGAGKTTLFRYIMEEKPLYTGTIRLDGVDIQERPAYFKNKIGLVSDENPFLLERTAKQNADILGVFYEAFDMDIFSAAMERMELSQGKTYGKMSRGEQMKFQMAFAMAHHPRLYLLDEATAGMDPVFRMDFFKLLHGVIEEEQASVLMTSHIASEMAQKTDYVGILEQGELLWFGVSMDMEMEIGIGKGMGV